MQNLAEIHFYPGLEPRLLALYMQDIKFGLRFLLKHSQLIAPILVKNVSFFRDGVIVSFEAKTAAEKDKPSFFRFRVSRRRNILMPYYSLLPPGWDGLRPGKHDWQ